MEGCKWLGLTAILILLASALAVTPALAQPQSEQKPLTVICQAVITSVSDNSVTVEVGGESLELPVEGRWLTISDKLETTSWTSAKDLVSEGPATIAYATLTEGGAVAKQVLMGVKQGETALFRPVLLKLYAKKHGHTKHYFSIYGYVAGKGENYLKLERNGLTAIALVKGRWLTNGGNQATWTEVSSRFNEGDLVRLFFHNIMVFKDDFAEAFNLKALIWGYSGAIIDITSGTILTRVPAFLKTGAEAA